MTESPLISICIPTFNRPGHLRAALDSCFAQTYRTFEIIIGDDSETDQSQTVVSEFQNRFPGKILYFRNTPSLGQSGNINALFNKADGLRLVLLHDDDLLLPRALQDLSNCWCRTPSLAAAFGKQHIMNMQGKILPEESEALNRDYGRTPEAAGAVVPGMAGIIRMFPNDGYMVLTERAREIGFRPFAEVGAACDFDFALRYCSDNGKVWFHNDYTTAYRISNDAISKTAVTAPFAYRVLSDYRAQHRTRLPPEIRRALRNAIKDFAPNAVSGYARMGQGGNALRIFSSSDYRLRDRFRFRFLLHGALTFAILVGGPSGVRLILRLVNHYHKITKHHEAAPMENS